MKVNRRQWAAKGRELFGPDETAWLFVCPSCGREMSIERVRSEFAHELDHLRDSGFRVEQECIGRYVAEVDCDWAAYGLFHGPLFVDGTPAFDFAGRPFTGGHGG